MSESSADFVSTIGSRQRNGVNKPRGGRGKSITDENEYNSI